jgi:hypothetical protein
MTDQPTLFPPPPATGTLTSRQSFVFDLLCAHPQDGLTSDEVGAELHARAGKHEAGVRCQWCHQEGVSVLKALRKKNLAKRRRAGGWVALGVERADSPSPGETEGYNPETAEIPY